MRGTPVRGVPVAGEALGFGELVGGHAGGEGVAKPDRPLTSTTRITNCGVSVATTTRSQHRRREALPPAQAERYG